MKMLILSALLCPLSIVSTIKAQGVKVSIETSNATYQIRISPGTNAVDYDKYSFQPASPGLCPAGAFVYLLDAKGAYLSSGTKKAYSSADMSSTLSLGHDYASLSGTNEFVSTPREISEILNGINLRVDADSIHRIKLGFNASLRINGVETNYVAESDWLPNPDEILKPFKAEPKPHKSH